MGKYTADPKPTLFLLMLMNFSKPNAVPTSIFM